ncbi:hypothetical protein [Vagococcus hydrophili]|uniref:Uncharacterized protein n=1 Tax=Vagococcus hydrophili TaxID=2714947 RepID=A0A6G8AUR1_9ENTE|nr:hypothetical protein [Vagococcus hydrophili]QIL47418.1 hypothetical protein G7082_02150 [Vagococcus hydrophili]QIL47915.1 hypothetical protein G7082_04895 [Vagococcus hydrophili]QIL48518.1 hypothetical protein G7082_08400 [Vagococcus hydrophili]QIL48727.1 hypothetical protein G7082_09525 [Vagococcus hydrophili]QIL48949.1 hypothetical protein G7082_10750 [Vagococcus hydrophili]
MIDKQEIVPVSLQPTPPKSAPTPNQTTQKIALRVKRDNMDITIYNGCNNYILNAALKEFNHGS